MCTYMKVGIINLSYTHKVCSVSPEINCCFMIFIAARDRNLLWYKRFIYYPKYILDFNIISWDFFHLIQYIKVCVYLKYPLGSSSDIKILCIIHPNYNKLVKSKMLLIIIKRLPFNWYHLIKLANCGKERI